VREQPQTAEKTEKTERKKSLSDKVREANQQSAANAQLRGGGAK
jgi:hypothetical protein